MGYKYTKKIENLGPINTEQMLKRCLHFAFDE